LEKDDGSAKDLCNRCKKPVRATEMLRFEGQIYHAYHYNCCQCKRELGGDYKELEGKLYCPNDYETVTAKVCFACRRAITGRSITALNKQFHPEV